jgi:hypothetical protein
MSYLLLQGRTVHCERGEQEKLAGKPETELGKVLVNKRPRIVPERYQVNLQDTPLTTFVKIDKGTQHYCIHTCKTAVLVFSKIWKRLVMLTLALGSQFRPL